MTNIFILNRKTVTCTGDRIHMRPNIIDVSKWNRKLTMESMDNIKVIKENWTTLYIKLI